MAAAALLREAAAAIYGAYYLLRGDKSGLGFFNASVAGFWNSFLALALVVPFFFVDLLVEYTRLPEGLVTTGAGLFAFERLAAYGMGWLVFPVAMLGVAKLIEREQRLLLFLVAYNWSSVIQAMILFPLSLVIAIGIIPDGLASFINYAAVVGLLFYAWYVIKSALDVDGLVAVLIISLDILLSFFVEIFTVKLL